ncbi:MAG: (2Fe-2S) ferredoxin domain-containing protein [Fibrobacter sp.]|nr:(2Fe-2S) ferredoxin domain-containing protein [Fibrobacter sp.]
MKKMTREDLEKCAKKPLPKTQYIKVGMSTCGIAAGAQEVYDVLVNEVKTRGINVNVCKTGCIGMCHAEPIIEVAVEGLPAVMYGRVTRDVALQVLEDHVGQKRLVNDHIFDLPVRR